MATSIVSRETPNARADWAKKALVFFAAGVGDSMPQVCAAALGPASVRILSSRRARDSGEGELFADDTGEAVGDLLGELGGLGLDHHPDQGLGPGGPEQHTPGVAQLGLGLGHGSGEHEVLVG